LSAPSGAASAPATHGDVEDDRRAAEVAAITETITRLVHQVISEDLDADAALDLDLDITADSSFSEDIELESIEFVALGEQLQLIYGEKVDLIGWFGELDLDEIVDLTVGELAEFIAACLADEVAVPGGAGA
jgi:acyl carrier protein